MPAFTVEQATAKLAEWQAAETAIATGAQSYMIAGRAFTRANLNYIGERITYYAGLVDRLSARATPGARVRRAVPFD